MVIPRRLVQYLSQIWGASKKLSPEPQYQKEKPMKKHAATLLILSIIALPGLVSAQTRALLKADVPFEFVANGKTMPAGWCIIQGRGDGQTILSINSGSEHMFVAPNSTESLKPSAKTSLVFHKYGDRYFLSSINREGDQRGYELPASSLEKELRAQNVIENDVVLVAAAN
jgi:hypothetical protein